MRIFFILFLALIGCNKYSVPSQNQNHPANPRGDVVIIELSPILDSDKSDPIKIERKDIYE
ncbi:MAG: hypothetical protein K1060chlam4_00350 [Candidatus Anoxychlamydiales bacterium]|nr:hypothetical protein [Candidatus Anoxychlamydiales bacterium]